MKVNLVQPTQWRALSALLLSLLLLSAGFAQQPQPATIRPRLELDVCAQADGHVDRRRAVVKQIEWPDVDGAARQIDAGRRRRCDSHSGIIRIPNPESLIPNSARDSFA